MTPPETRHPLPESTARQIAEWVGEEGTKGELN